MADRVAFPDEVPAPHPNGSVHTRRPRLRRRLLWTGLVALGAVWAYAIWYSVTRPTPEPLDDAARDRAEAVCLATLDDLRAIPDAPAAGRAEAENSVFRRMVTDLRAIEPSDPDGREAFGSWLDDWDDLVAARERFAERRAEGEAARLLIPVADRAPVSVRMDEYAGIHGLDECSTQTLRAEVVEGDRGYRAP